MNSAGTRRWRALRMVVAVMLAFGTAAATVTIGSGVAAAAAPKALINASTVSGSPSQEQKIATDLGYDVTVVSDAVWGAMTAADFGQYDLLIAGDPTCGSLPPGLISSVPVFGSVVLGTAGGRTAVGNRIVVGTDPVFHDSGDYTSPGARGTIIREGIAFAGTRPGTTGMYFDPTCAGGQAAGIRAILTAISTGAGSWSVDATPPCGGSVSLIASNPAFAGLTTSSLQGWSCSVHESFPTFPTDWSALAVATDTITKPTCGIDPGTGLGACGEAYILIAGGAIVVNSVVISVGPLDATNPVGTTHTVTANVHAPGGTPVVPGQAVTFTVTGQNAGATGTCAPVDCKSDAAGNVSFTYADAAGAGDDTIKASFTDTAGSLQTATAQKHWVAVAAAATATSYGGGSSVQYSDPVTLSGTLVDSATSSGISGKQLGFTLGTQSAVAGPTDGLGSAATSLVVTQQPGSVSSVQTAFAGDAGYAPSSDSDPFAITKEDCSVAYTGDTLVNSTTTTKLSAQFGEPDSSPGDWSGKSITFKVTDASLATQTFSATTNAAGLASTTAALGPNVYGVSASFAGDANYVDCATASDTVVTVVVPPTECPAAKVDETVTKDYSRDTRSLISPKLTTDGGRLLVAFVGADGPLGKTQEVTGVSGGGLTWTLASKANKTWGTTEVWYTKAPLGVTDLTVEAKLKFAYHGTITVVAFDGASGIGAVATATGTKGSPAVTVTPTKCGSLLWAAGHDWTSDASPTPAAGQSLASKFIDTTVHDSYWTSAVNDPTKDLSPVTIKVTGPTKDLWTYAAVEILGT